MKGRGTKRILLGIIECTIVTTFLYFIYRNPESRGMAPVFILFDAACFITIILGFRERIYGSRIKRNGERTVCMVAEYAEDNSLFANGKPTVAIKARYIDDDGMVKEVIVTTGQYEKKAYPLHSFVEIAIDKESNEGVLIGKTDKRLPKRIVDILIHADHEATASDIRRTFFSINCPKCGATMMIANHGTGRCQYCG